MLQVLTHDLAARKFFTALKTEFDKQSIHKLVNTPTSLNNLKTKIGELDAVELKTVPVYLKK